MAAGNNPIFVATPAVDWYAGACLTANTAKDCATGTVYTVFTAGSNGSYLTKLVARAAGTNIATVMRVFINNGSTSTTAANNILFAELALPATTLTETAAQPTYELPLGIALPAGYKIIITIATGVAAGYYVSVVGGDY